MSPPLRRQYSIHSVDSVEHDDLLPEVGEVPEVEQDCQFCGHTHDGECESKSDKSEHWWRDYELAERANIPYRFLLAMRTGTNSTFRSMVLELQFSTKMRAVVFAEGMANARYLRRFDLRGAPMGQDLHNTWYDLGVIQDMMMPLLRCEGVRAAVRAELREVSKRRATLRDQFDDGMYMDDGLQMIRRDYNVRSERIGGRMVSEILREKKLAMEQLALEIKMIKEEADKSTKYE